MGSPALFSRFLPNQIRYVVVSNHLTMCSNKPQFLADTSGATGSLYFKGGVIKSLYSLKSHSFAFRRGGVGPNNRLDFFRFDIVGVGSVVGQHFGWFVDAFHNQVAID